MTNSLNPVVVVGGGSTGLGLVRYFGRMGTTVHVISHGRDPAFYSKYCKRSYTISGMRYDRLALKRVLKEISKKSSKRAVVYPSSDLDALNLAILKQELPDDYYFAVGNEESVRILVDKRMFYKELSKNRIAHPRTYFPEDLADAQILAAQLSFPVFLRPPITQLFVGAFPRHGKGFVAQTSRELLYYYRLATKNGIDIMFQEVIPGPSSNSYQFEGYYNAKHSPLVTFARQRLRIWPSDFGNTTLCVSISLEKLANEKTLVNKFLGTIGYHGLMSAEFKKDDRDGILKLLEINSRPWAHFWLSEHCGANIILASYLDALGEDASGTYREKYEIGVKSMHLSADIRAVIQMFRTKKLSLREWMLSLRDVQCFMFLSRDDISPFIITSAIQGYHLSRFILSGKLSDAIE